MCYAKSTMRVILSFIVCVGTRMEILRKYTTKPKHMCAADVQLIGSVEAKSGDSHKTCHNQNTTNDMKQRSSHSDNGFSVWSCFLQERCRNESTCFRVHWLSQYESLILFWLITKRSLVKKWTVHKTTYHKQQATNRTNWLVPVAIQGKREWSGNESNN